MELPHSFFQDFDGKYYRLQFSVANNDKGKVPYNIGDIEERSFPTLSGSSAKEGGALNGKASRYSVSDSNTDVKQQFSLSPEADRAYMDAVENANIEAAQVMVDEAAKQAGFTEEVYHGTRRGFGFTKYDPSKSNAAPALFTSGDLAVARSYSQDDGVTNISLVQELGLTAGNYRFFANTEGMIEILCWHYLFSRLESDYRHAVVAVRWTVTGIIWKVKI